MKRSARLAVLMLTATIVPNCRDAGVEGPFGDFLFLEQYAVEHSRVLEGDSTRIPIAVCDQSDLGSSYSYDVRSRRLSIYYFNRTFDIENMTALVGRTLVPSWFISCGFRSPEPVYSLPSDVGGFEILSVLERGDLSISVGGVSRTILANDSLVFPLSADTIRGVYSIPPDTTQLPYAVELVRANTIRNFGFWPRTNVTFIGN